MLTSVQSRRGRWSSWFIIFFSWIVLISGCHIEINDSLGKALVRKRCTNCHSTASIYRRGRSPQEWKELVDAMIGHGAKLTEEERKTIVKFLSEEYP